MGSVEGSSSRGGGVQALYWGQAPCRPGGDCIGDIGTPPRARRPRQIDHPPHGAHSSRLVLLAENIRIQEKVRCENSVLVLSHLRQCGPTLSGAQGASHLCALAMALALAFGLAPLRRACAPSVGRAPASAREVPCHGPCGDRDRRYDAPTGWRRAAARAAPRPGPCRKESGVAERPPLDRVERHDPRPF